MLVSQSRALPPGPPLWVTEREVPSRLRPALTLDKPRIGGGSGPNLSPVPKNLDRVEEEEEEEEQERQERACSTIPKVVAFASRSFISPFTVVSGLRPTQ